jgi:subtilisin family serine protease
VSTTTRLLLKLQPGVKAKPVQGGPELRPLHPAIQQERAKAAVPAWYLVDLLDIDPSPWDAAHSLVKSASVLGLEESNIICAEPDLLQRWLYRNVKTAGNPPTGPHFAWHLDHEYSQLRCARQSVQFTPPRVRIAHIDTGYDPTHTSCPENILTSLERNFADENNPHSAVDPNNGYPFEQSGHGTGTLALLAGNRVSQNQGDYLGGAPAADIVPIRIADSVILFATSALAQAINYAVEQNCDVASISMGGVPSFAWCDAVNSAYEAGLCIIAASGDCIAGIPTHYVVYPAHFQRTIAVCGVMADGTPYYDIPPPTIEGNWGPSSAMTEAMAAWTPHTPWAEIGTGGDITEDGAGTSCATPQVAAAAALWLEKNKGSVPRNWKKIEAVRQALFASAANPNKDSEHFGHGILKANDALNQAPAIAIPQTPADSAYFDFLELIAGNGNPSVCQDGMFRLEMTQRWVLSQTLQNIIPDPVKEPSPEQLKKFVESLIHDPQISAELRSHLKQRRTKL